MKRVNDGALELAARVIEGLSDVPPDAGEPVLARLMRDSVLDLRDCRQALERADRKAKDAEATSEMAEWDKTELVKQRDEALREIDRLRLAVAAAAEILDRALGDKGAGA